MLSSTICRRHHHFALLLGIAFLAASATPANAQYASSFWTRNPRTGQVSGFSVNYGSGYTSSNIFVSRPGYTYSTSGGYDCGQVWGGYSNQTPRQQSQFRWRR